MPETKSLSSDCPFGESCANFDSWKCQFCRSNLPHQIVNYRCFKDRDYYRKTVPFIEVHWLFEMHEGA